MNDFYLKHCLDFKALAALTSTETFLECPAPRHLTTIRYMQNLC